VAEGLAVAAPASPAGTVQSNESKAISLALNLNKTEQEIEQGQAGRPADVSVQAAGQLAGNVQYADSSAASIQYGAENRNSSFGLPHDGCKQPCVPYDPCGRDRCKPDDGCKEPCVPYKPCGYDRCKPDPCDTWKCGDWDPCSTCCGREKRTHPPVCRPWIRDGVVPLAG
jgi:hypothetical protein